MKRMSPEAAALIVAVSLLCGIILISVIFTALWEQRVVVAWSMLAAGGLALIVFLFVYAARSFNEMQIRQERFYHQQETPLHPEARPPVCVPARMQAAQPQDASYGHYYSPLVEYQYPRQENW